MLFARGWKLCLESCSSSSHISIFCISSVFLPFFIFLLFLLNSFMPCCCSKTAAMEHLSFDIHVCEKKEMTVGNKVLLSWMKNCNFLFQNLQLRITLTLKFCCGPYSYSKATLWKGKKPQLTQTFTDIWSETGTYIFLGAHSIIYRNIHFRELCNIWELAHIK